MIQGDALALPLRDASVDLVVTSPPYFNVRGDDGIGNAETVGAYLADLWLMTKELARVLKPTGSLFINIGDRYSSPGGAMRNGTSSAASFAAQRVGQRFGDKSRYGNIPAKSLMGIPWRYAIGCIDGQAGGPWWLRAEIIWAKKNPMPDSAFDRVWRSHEQWFHLALAPTPYYSEDARVEAKTPGYKKRMPGSVWLVGPNTLKVPSAVYTKFGIDRHDAPFPPEWPERIIAGWCPPGGVVLDPCSGSGTTGMIAQQLGRVPVCIDLDSRYARLSAWRTQNGTPSKHT